jgi:integrase
MVSGKVTSRKDWARDKADEIEKYRLMGEGELKPQSTKISDVYKHYIFHCQEEVLRRKQQGYGGLSIKTLEHMEDHLKFFLELYGKKSIGEVKLNMIQQYEKTLRAERKTLKSGEVVLRFGDNGIHTKLRAVRTFLNWATDEKYFYVSPVKDLKIEEDIPVGRALTDDEIYKVFDIGCKFNKELYDIVMVLVYAGLREGEVVSLKKEQVRDGMIYIERCGMTKRKKEKIIPILPPIQYIFDRVKCGEIFPGWNENLRMYKNC